MPKQSHGYRHHRASGQAFVRLGGKQIYLGKHGSEESLKEYKRVLADWKVKEKARSIEAGSDESGIVLTVNELVEAFRKHAFTYYRRLDGSQTAEYGCYGIASKPLRKLCGGMPVSEFRQSHLKAVREEMVKSKWARKSINAMIGRIRNMFRWGVENELVPSSVYHALLAVKGLHAGLIRLLPRVRRERATMLTYVLPFA